MITLPDKNSENVQMMLNKMSPKTRLALSVVVEKFNDIKWKTVEFVDNSIPEPSHRPRLCGRRVYVPGAAKHQKFFQKSLFQTEMGYVYDAVYQNCKGLYR